MGGTYKGLLAATPAGEQPAKEAQRLWIEERDKECLAASEESREGCLKEATDRRKNELEDQLRQRLGLSVWAYNWINA